MAGETRQEVVKADFDRNKEEVLWFPVVEGLGFAEPELAPSWDDFQSDSDILAGGQRFGVRTRNLSGYRGHQLRQYIAEFTLRYSRPSGTRTEWHKLFDDQGNEVPDFLCYGWTSTGTELVHWLLISVSWLREAQKRGWLRRCQSRIARNTDSRRSELHITSITCLREHLHPENFGRLFPHRSEGHPAFA